MCICVDSYMYVCFDHISHGEFIWVGIFPVEYDTEERYTVTEDYCKAMIVMKNRVKVDWRRSGIEASEMDAEVSELLSLVGSKMLKSSLWYNKAYNI